MSTTVIACIQQVPSGDGVEAADDPALEVKDISATAEDYLSAVDAVESQVPEGWRVLYVRSDGTLSSADEVALTTAEAVDIAPTATNDTAGAQTDEA